MQASRHVLVPVNSYRYCVARRMNGILVLLALAAAINVLIAWWIHMHVEVLSDRLVVREPTPTEVEWWRQNKPARLPGTPVGYAEWRVRCRQAIIVCQNPYVEPSPPGTIDAFVDIGRCGWPFLSMENIIWNTRGMRSQELHGVWNVPVHWWFGPFAGQWVPVRVAWVGFVVNTLFYACGLWLMLLTAKYSKRRLRRMRGRCPACAYPIGAGDRCTECGGAVPMRRQAVS